MEFDKFFNAIESILNANESGEFATNVATIKNYAELAQDEINNLKSKIEELEETIKVKESAAAYLLSQVTASVANDLDGQNVLTDSNILDEGFTFTLDQVFERED